jgi:hypothetical protein
VVLQNRLKITRHARDFADSFTNWLLSTQFSLRRPFTPRAECIVPMVGEGLWQGFPFYITLVQLTIRVWYRGIPVPDAQPNAATKASEINALRKAYYFASFPVW